MRKAYMRVSLLLVCLMLFGAGSGQQLNVTEAKQAALTTVEAIRGISPSPITPQHWPKGNSCDMNARNLYAGEPFLVRSLIRPTGGDLARLRRRVETAHREDPDFIGDAQETVRATRLNYRDYYEVPIYHRTCGYMFHVQPGDETDGELGWGAFTPVGAQKAQMLLGAAELPTFALISSLTFSNDGYMWVAGSRAVNAFYPGKRYRIVNRAGEPVAPLETRLTPQIFRESFVTTGGESSAYWHLLLPVRLEPLKRTPSP